MKIQQLHRWPAFITGAAIFGILIGFGLILDVQAQTDKKSVKLAYKIRPQIKFSDLKVGQQDLKFDEGFDAEPDWIKNLSFKLENISGKRIVFLTLSVNFPETRFTGNMMSYQIMLGELPNGRKLKDSKPMLLMPGETSGVSLDKEKDGIYKFINGRQPIETIQKVELEISLIVFEDKTAWSSGNFLRQDPTDPGKFTPLENEPQQ